MSEDVLADAELIMDKMERDGWRLTPFRALAAEVRALRKDRERLDAILKRRKAHAWNEELGYSVALENREMVDAWLEDIDAALSARSGEDSPTTSASTDTETRPAR